MIGGPLLPEALPHERATLGAGEVRAVSARRFHEITDLRQTVFGKPAFAPAALNGSAIGLHFIHTDSLVGAFVAEYP
jgi:hypothetical protein